MGSYGVGVSRAVACVAEGNHDELGLVLAARAQPRRRARRRHRQGRGRLRQGRGGHRASSRRRASACCTTTAARSAPGVKFKDAELIGVPTIVVVGRNAGRAASIEVKDRAHRRQARRRGGEAVDEIVAEVRGTSRPDGRHGGRRRAGSRSEAVIFDWGGTLTPWHTVDLAEQWRSSPRAVHEDEERAAELAARILAGEDHAWHRARTGQGSAHLDDLLREVGLDPRRRRARGRRSRRTGGSGSRTPSPTRRCGRCGRGCASAACAWGCCPTRSGRGSTTAACSSATGCST